MKNKQVQIDRVLFVEICRYFGLLESFETPNEDYIKNGLQDKINAIERRFAYEDIIKTKPNTIEHNEAVLNYLELK